MGAPYRGGYRPRTAPRRQAGSGKGTLIGLAVIGVLAYSAGEKIAVPHAPAHKPAPASTAPAQPAQLTSADGNVAAGKSLAALHGWGSGRQWGCLHALWQRESGWQNTIVNKQSGAFGIAQALGHGTPRSAAGGVTVRYVDGHSAYGMTVNEYPSKAANRGDTKAQVNWGLGYIGSAYGTPCGAWQHEEAAGWY